MNNTYIFAIGGTGARVLRSLTMLLASGYKGSSSSETVIPIIIDYDTENGSTEETQKLLECYQKISSAAFKNKKDVKDTFFCTQVRKLRDVSKAPARLNNSTRFEVYLDPKEVESTFAEHIGYGTINDTNGTGPTRYLLDSLYDTSEGVNAELKLSLKKGFKGCPNIGCVVTKRLTDTEEIRQFLSLPNKDDKILIIGSIFGGTGASGIPMLLDMLKDEAGLPENVVGVIAVEPYFKVVPSKNSVINSATFEAKTKAALEAYDLGTSVNKLADAVYYVGDDRTSGAFNNEEGGVKQKNPAHVAELVAAICACDFMERDIKINKGFDAAFFETWIDQPALEIDEEERNDAQEKKQVVLKAESFGDLAGAYIDPLCKLGLFNQFCKNYYLTCGNGDRTDVWLKDTGLNKDSELRGNLKEFITAFESWITEMEDIKRPFKILDLADKEYKGLIEGKKMVRSRLRVLTDYAVTDKAIREDLGRLRNNLDTQPQEREEALKHPVYLFMTWMEKVITDRYKTIQEWTNS